MLRAVVFVAVLSLAAAFPRKPEMAVDREMVEHLNANQSTWIATAENKFSRWTMLEAQRLMGVRSLVPSGETPIKTHKIAAEDIPTDFDCRKQWPTGVSAIRNQEQCGSCWAFSGAEVLSDRFNIASNGSVNVILSPEDMVSCDTGDMGCSGGYLDAEWNYLVKTGIVTDACFPYTAGSGVAAPCAAKCADSEAWKKYKAADSFHLTSVADIQAELMKNGPLQVAFEVRKSFLAYKSGVYSHHFYAFWDSILGGHAVKLVGWGVENNIPYWTIANSWGESWGEQGYFRIKRGVNECGIEAMVYGGHAAL